MKLSLLALYENLNPKLKAATRFVCPVSPGPYLSACRPLSRGELRDKPEVGGIEVDKPEGALWFLGLGGLSASDLGKGTIRLPDACALLKREGDDGIEARYALIVQDDEAFSDVVGALLDVFGRFAKWVDEAQRLIIRGGSLSAVVNLCSMVTPDTVYVTGVGMKLHAHTSPTIMDEISAVWSYQVRHGYWPIDIMAKMVASGEMAKIVSHRDAFTPQETSFNNVYTCKNVYVNKVLRAHIFIVALYSPPLQTHKEIATQLGNMLQPMIAADDAFKTGAGDFYESFFQDLVNGRIDPGKVSQQISVFGWKMDDSFSLLVADPCGQDDGMVMQLIRRLNDYKLDCRAFVDGANMVCIARVADKGEREQFVGLAEKMLRQFSMKGALSQKFDGIQMAIAYLPLTRVILEEGLRAGGSQVLFQQREYGLHSILHACLEGCTAHELCHPDVALLEMYDAKHGSELVKTLLYYLLYDCNSVAAAKALFVHRNTMTHRLSRICELLSVDLLKPDLYRKLFYLISILLLLYNQSPRDFANVLGVADDARANGLRSGRL